MDNAVNLESVSPYSVLHFERKLQLATINCRLFKTEFVTSRPHAYRHQYKILAFP